MDYESTVKRIWEVREAKRELLEQEKQLTTEYEELKRYLINNLIADQVNSLATSKARITLTKRTTAKLIPEIGWTEFVDYVAATNSYHLLQKQVSAAACKEQIIVLGEPIPGVELLEINDLSLTTISPKA